jgi:hypothetical protein
VVSLVPVCDRLCDCGASRFGVDEMPEAEIKGDARIVIQAVRATARAQAAGAPLARYEHAMRPRRVRSTTVHGARVWDDRVQALVAQRWKDRCH